MFWGDLLRPPGAWELAQQFQRAFAEAARNFFAGVFDVGSNFFAAVRAIGVHRDDLNLLVVIESKVAVTALDCGANVLGIDSELFVAAIS